MNSRTTKHKCTIENNTLLKEKGRCEIEMMSALTNSGVCQSVVVEISKLIGWLKVRLMIMRQDRNS